MTQETTIFVTVLICSCVWAVICMLLCIWANFCGRQNVRHAAVAQEKAEWRDVRAPGESSGRTVFKWRT